MKILKSLTLLFSSLVIMSCGSDDDSGSVQLPIILPTPYVITAENIVGEYTMTDYSAEESEITILNSNGNEASSISSIHTGDRFTVVLTLTDDNIYTVGGSYSFDDVNTIDGVETAGNGDIVSLEESGTYELDIDNEMITFISAEGVFSGVYSIESIDDNNAVFVETINEESLGNEITIVTNNVYSFSFSR